jgi:hypothetical protein
VSAARAKEGPARAWKKDECCAEEADRVVRVEDATGGG